MFLANDLDTPLILSERVVCWHLYPGTDWYRLLWSRASRRAGLGAQCRYKLETRGCRTADSRRRGRQREAQHHIRSTGEFQLW